VAAIQAPVIMMSQNRSAATKDRLNAEHDYVVNLRAELEIMLPARQAGRPAQR
jgi:uncharacterized membrane protein